MQGGHEGDDDVQQMDQLTAEVLANTERKMAKRAGVKPANFQPANGQTGASKEPAESGERIECRVILFPLARRMKRGWEW